MNSNSKRWIFGVLCAAYSICSLLVFTSEENISKGEGFLTPEAKRGKLLFQKHNCTACHQFFGLGGYMGPDLTNVISSKGEIGAKYAAAMIKMGSQKMPNLHLTDDEVNCLVAFLSYVDKSEISPPKEFEINTIGTVEINH